MPVPGPKKPSYRPITKDAIAEITYAIVVISKL